MALFDIVPDIHGQAEKLSSLLKKLGWNRSRGYWSGLSSDHHIVFLGDLIDRGPENRKVVKTVRELVDSGRAYCIMGNHELNAIHYHLLDERTGKPAKERTPRRTRTHKSFLNEFSIGAPDTIEIVKWFTTLPLWMEFDTFRVVHACWSDRAVARLAQHCEHGVLNERDLLQAGTKGADLFEEVELLTKGPEWSLPEGYFFTDQGGQERSEVRVAWWRSGVTSWQDVAVSVPNLNDLPNSAIPPALTDLLYPPDAKPLFFGHYWMTGEPRLERQNSNSFCLDYSAGADGPLLAYRHNAGCNGLAIENVIVV